MADNVIEHDFRWKPKSVPNM